MKIGHPKDFWGGILFVVIGGTFALIAKGLTIGDTTLISGYSMGTPARMGPAFFPFYLGLMLFALGVVIAINGVRSAGGPDSAFPKFHWLPIAFVLGSVIMFGLILRPLGMLIAGFLLVVVSSMGNPEKVKWRGVIFLAIGLVVFTAMTFVWGLGLPIPLCPDVEAIQSSIGFCRG